MSLLEANWIIQSDEEMDRQTYRRGDPKNRAFCIRWMQTQTADADTDFVYSADSVQKCDDWYTNGHFLLFDCY